MRILDIGTGTGCLLLTLLAELPLATGLGTDISAAALDDGSGERRRLGAHGARRLRAADVLDGVDGPLRPRRQQSALHRHRGHRADLTPEVREFDPRAALDGGPDGLAIYRRIIAGLPRVLQGWVVFEVGAGQAEAVAQLLQQAFVKTRHAEVARYSDLGGHTRCVAFRVTAVNGRK